MKSENGTIARTVRVLTRGLLVTSGVMILCMAFASTYGVARRYFLRNPEPYSYEIGMMLLLWCFVLAVAALQEQERHLRGDFILNRMPRAFQTFVNRILSPALAVLCSAVLTWKGWDAAVFSYRIGERSMSAWAEPLFPVKIVIPVGYAFLLLVAALQLFQGVHAVLRTGRTGARAQGNG